MTCATWSAQTWQKTPRKLNFDNCKKWHQKYFHYWKWLQLATCASWSAKTWQKTPRTLNATIWENDARKIFLLLEMIRVAFLSLQVAQIATCNHFPQIKIALSLIFAIFEIKRFYPIFAHKCADCASKFVLKNAQVATSFIAYK